MCAGHHPPPRCPANAPFSQKADFPSTGGKRDPARTLPCNAAHRFIELNYRAPSKRFAGDKLIAITQWEIGVKMLKRTSMAIILIGAGLAIAPAVQAQTSSANERRNPEAIQLSEDCHRSLPSMNSQTPLSRGTSRSGGREG